MADYLSVSEVARLLNVSEQELRSRCERKELTAQLRDGEWRIAAAEMDRLKSEFGDPFASLMALGGDDFDFGSPPPAPGPAEAGSGMEISMSNLNQDLPDPLGGLGGGGDDFFGGGGSDFGGGFGAPAAGGDDDYSAGDDAGRKSIFDEMMEDDAPAEAAPAADTGDDGLFGGGAMPSFPADAAAFAVDQEAGEVHPPEISDSFMTGGGLDDLDSLMGMAEEVAAPPPAPALPPIQEMVPPGSKSSQKTAGASEPSAADWDIDDENVPPPGLPTDMEHGTAWTDSLLMESEIELTNSAEPVSKVDTFNPLHDPDEVEAALGEMAAAGLGPMNLASVPAAPTPPAPAAETPVAAETPAAEAPVVLPVAAAFPTEAAAELPETVEMAALPVEFAEPAAEAAADEPFVPAAEAVEAVAEAVEPFAPVVETVEPVAEIPTADAPALFAAAAADEGNELFRDSGLSEAWVAPPEAVAPQGEPSSFMAAPEVPAAEIAQSTLGTGWEGNLFDSGLRESSIPEEPSFPPMPEAAFPEGDDDNAMFRESTLPGEGWQTAEIVADAPPAQPGAIDSALAGSLLVESVLPEGVPGADVPAVGPIRTLAAALDEVPLPPSAVDVGESSWTNSPLTETILPEDDALASGNVSAGGDALTASDSFAPSDALTASDALTGSESFPESVPGDLSAADAATLSADLGRPAEMPLSDADEISGISTMTPAPPVNEATELSPLHDTGFSGSLLESEDDDLFAPGGEAAEAPSVPFPAAGSGLSAFSDEVGGPAEEAAGMDLTGMLDEPAAPGGELSASDDVPKETLEFTPPTRDSDVLEIALTGDEAGSLVQVEEVQEEELDELPADETSDEPMQLEEAVDEGPIRLYGGDVPAGDTESGEVDFGEVAPPTLGNTADAFEGDVDDSIPLSTGSGLLAEADVLSGDLDLGEGAMQTLKGPAAGLEAADDDDEAIQLSAGDEEIFGGATTIGSASDSSSQLDYHADDDVLGGNLEAGEGAMQTLKGSSSAFGADSADEEIELSTGDENFFGTEETGVSSAAAVDEGAEIELSTGDDNFFGSDVAAGSTAPTAGADFGEADFGGMDLGQPSAFAGADFGQPSAFAGADFGQPSAFAGADFGDADVLGGNLDLTDGGMQTLKGSPSGFRQADEEREIPISAADDMFGGDADVLGGDLEVAEGGMQTVKGPIGLFGTGDDEEVELSGADAHSLDEPVGGELGDSEIMGPNDEDYQGAIEIETPMESEPNEPQFGTVLTDEAEAADINTMHTMQGSAEDLLGLGNRVTLSAKGVDESASVLGDNLDLEDSDDKGTFTGSREKLAAMGDRIEVSASDAADSDSNVVEIAAPDSGAGILDEDLDLLGADDSSSQTVVGKRPVPAATYGDDDDENPQIDMSAMDDGSGSSNEYDPSGQTMVGQLPNMAGRQQVQLRSGEEDEADSDVRVTPGGYADESDVRMAPGNTAMDSSMEVVPLDDASGSSQELQFSSGDSAIHKRDDADTLASYRTGDPAASPARNLPMGLPDESSSMSIDLDKEMQLEPDIDLAAGAGDFDLAGGIAEGGIEKTIDFGLAPALSGDDEPLTLGTDDDTAAQFAAAAAQLEENEQDPSSMTAEAAVLGVPEADAGSSLSYAPDTGTSGFGFRDAADDDGGDDLVLSGSGASDITLNPSASGIGIGGSQSGLALERTATSGVDLDKDFGGATVVSANLPSDDNDFLIPDVAGENDDSNLSSSIVALEGELGDINEGAPTNVGIDLGPMLGAETMQGLGAADLASSVNLGPQSGIGLASQPSSVGLGGMPAIGIGSGLGQPMASGLGQPMASGLGQPMASGVGFPQSSSMNIQASSIGAPMASGVGYGNQPYGQPAYGGQPAAGSAPSYLPGQRIVLPPPEIAFTGADLALVVTPTVFLLLGGLFMFQLTLFNGGQWHGVWEFSQSLVDAIGKIGT